MKLKYLLLLVVISISMPATAFALQFSIKVVFNNDWDELFAPDGGLWNNVATTGLEAGIVARITEDFSDYSIPVSTSSGDLTVTIGGAS